MSEAQGTVNVRVDELFRLLSLRKLGTGTLASLVGASPDAIQRLIALKGGPAELVGKIADIIGDGFVVEDRVEPPSLSVAATIEAIEAGELDPDEVLLAELERAQPRKTLLRYLQGEE